MRFFIPLSAAAAVVAAPAAANRPIEFVTSAPAEGTLVVPLRNADHLGHAATILDAAARDAVARALQAAEFDFKRNSTLSLRGIGAWSQILVVGTGETPFQARYIEDIGGNAVQKAGKGPITIVTQTIPSAGPQAALQLAAGAQLGAYSFDVYKSDKKPTAAAPVRIVTADAAARKSRDQVTALTEAVAFTRNLATEPANVLYPEVFVERTRTAFKGVPNVSIQVLDVPAMEKLGMGSILSVGKGSVRPPRLLIVHYRGAAGAPVALAGKGITFDSGGISLKPGSGMWAMKGDMAGAAAVVGTALSLARSRAPVNVVAIAALAENMPSGGATRPGDVVRAMNGKTIEILNTDAEGRLVLADAVAYAERQFRPAAIVDVATLTGAVSTALGDEYAGLLTRHDGLADQLLNAGRTTGEELWRLPLHPNYADDMKSDIADIKNVVEGGAPGAGLGGHFIGEFVAATPWAHLDIASVDWRSTALPTVPKGSAGFGVRLLDRFVRDFRPVTAAATAASN